MVIDLAMTATGEWIVIECNDAMESGYAGVSPLGLWQSLLDAVRVGQQSSRSLQDPPDEKPNSNNVAMA